MVPERVTWAVEQLAIRPRDRILEIGCGSGHATRLVSEKLESGTVTAIDRSALQVSKARALNRDAIVAGRVRVERLSLSDAPAELGEHAFDKIFAINVNAFWTTPATSCASVVRLLGRKGRAYLIYEPPSDASARKLRTGLPRLLEAHGLASVEIEQTRLATTLGLCLVAHR
jgi:protein-L-isoaspartate O-methyltransferase